MKTSKRLTSLLMAVLLFASVFCFYIPASAHEDLIYDSEVGKGSKRVFDFADLYSDGEEEKIQSNTDKAIKRTGMDIVIVTINDSHGKTWEAYADDFFDYNGFGKGTNKDGVLFLIDMQHRQLHISTCGAAIKKLTNQKIDSIFDGVQPYITDKEYYDGTMVFIKRVKKMLGVLVLDYSPLKVMIILLITLLVAFIYYKRVQHQYKYNGVAETYAYRDKSKLNLTNKSDVLVDTVVVSERIESSSSSGGGGGGSSTHTSSSGTSHGGGSRGF